MSDIISQLKALKLHGMADDYAELQSQGATGATATMESSVWLLRHLLEAESTDRAIRSIRYQINAARFPVHRNLAGFDFSQSKVDEQLIGQLATMAFTDAAQNVAPVLARRIWQRQSVSQAFSITASGYASTPRSNWLILWSARRPPANRASWLSA